MQNGDQATGDGTDRWVPPPRKVIDPVAAYDNAKLFYHLYGSWLPEPARQNFERFLQQQEYGTSPDAAAAMRAVSHHIWQSDQIYQLLGLSDRHPTTPLQREYNHKLVSHNPNGSLNYVVSDQLVGLFPPGGEARWPKLVLTANHARAWRQEDLSGILQGFKRLAVDAGVRESDICRLRADRPATDAAGKTLFLAACHTERDPFMNGAELIDRRNALRSDPNAAHPEKRTLAHISPAAMRLAKLMFKLMTEPESHLRGKVKLIDLDRSEIDNEPRFKAAPLVADFVGQWIQGNESGISKEKPLTLRADAAQIAAHISLVGFSKGSNTVTDALRFLYQELKGAQSLSQMRTREGGLREVTDTDIRAIMQSVRLLSVAAGEVPLTEAERNVGMRRTTIYNKYDMVAGHMIVRDRGQYHPEQDRLIEVTGTRDHAGHGLPDTLGTREKSGFLMDGGNPEARAAIEAFFGAARERKTPGKVVEHASRIAPYAQASLTIA